MNDRMISSDKDPHIHKTFSQAYILGGSPCSGKSTIAKSLADRYDLGFYKIDDYSRDHQAVCQPGRHPVMSRISRMGWNEIWSRPVATQVQEEMEYYREEFELILADLGGYDPGKPIILEGAALLPELIAALPVNRNRVLYLVPTEAFQHLHYSRRPWIQKILADCEDPDQAFENWMKRDQLFGVEIIRQAEVYKYRTLLVDGGRGIVKLVETVSDLLGLS